jgi:hypothetical protein
MLRHLTRSLFPSALLACSFCGCVPQDLLDTQIVDIGPKLTAFRKVVAKYKQSPGDFASDKERYRYNDELKAVQEAFTGVPLEVSKNRKEAEAVVRLWQSELEGKYSGELPRVLQIEIESIYMKILDSD